MSGALRVKLGLQHKFEGVIMKVYEMLGERLWRVEKLVIDNHEIHHI